MSELVCIILKVMSPTSMKTPLNPNRHQLVNYITTYLGMGNVVALRVVTKEYKYIFKMNRGVHKKNITS
jgi:hypothetical protein